MFFSCLTAVLNPRKIGDKLIMTIVRRTLVILLAASLVILAAMFLANTEWADGFRTGRGPGPERPALTRNSQPGILDSGQSQQVAGGQVHGDRGRKRSTTSRFFISLLDILVKVGIPALLTVCLVKAGKKFFRQERSNRCRVNFAADDPSRE